MTQRCLHVRVRGRVQGVSFRYYTQKQAEHLGLDGWVRNLPDGSVEACIRGESEGVEAMCRWLERGPSYAAVTGIDFTEADPATAGQGFTIR